MRYWLIVLGVVVGLLATQATSFAQSDVRLTISPERAQRNNAGPITLIVIVENNAAQNIQIVSFRFENESLSLTPIRPLPKDITANTAATGLYAITIDQEATYALVGTLTYTLTGQQHVAVAQAEVKLQPEPGIWRDLELLLAGALISILGGVLADVGKGWLERRRQADKALGVLIPALAVCIRAVEQNREAPVELWQEVYFKEGLHSALVGRANWRGRAAIMLTIAQLYARLREYNTDRQLVDRAELKADLENAQAVLQQLA